MKAAKIFTLDVELIERLQKEPNASALVNGLIDKWYNSSLIAMLTEEERKGLRELNNEIMKLTKERVAKYGV